MAGRTSTIYKCLDPEWNEQVLMEFPVTDGDHELRLAIIDEYRDHEDNKMGEVCFVSLSACVYSSTRPSL